MSNQTQNFVLPDLDDDAQKCKGSFFYQAYNLLKKDWEDFVADVVYWREYVNANEPELLRYVAKPEGIMLWVEWVKRMDCKQLREEWMGKSSAAKELFLEIFYERTKKIMDLSKRIENFESKAHELYENRHYQEALQLVKPIIADIETLDYFKETEHFEFYDFENIIQERLWRNFEGRTKEIRCAYLPVGYIYRCYGWLLFQCGLKKDAREAFETACKWNPISVRTIFKLAELFSSEEIDLFYDRLQYIHKYCYTKRDLAECYRGFAYVFTRKQKYKDALCCYKIGRCYTNSPDYMRSELSEIALALDGNVPDVTIEDILKSSEYHNYPVGVNREIFQIATYYGNEYSKQGDKESASEFYSIMIEFFDNQDDKKAEYGQIVN